MRRLALLALPMLLSLPARAQEADPPTPASVVAAAAPEEWVAITPDDLLVMDLAPDARGHARRVVIQLLPPPFSQPWVDNIRRLARVHWWDGTQVYRVVDNWVAQWGDVSEAKPLPDGVVAPVVEYTSPISNPYSQSSGAIRAFRRDPYASSFIQEGWPLAFANESILPLVDANTGQPIPSDGLQAAWPLHCYASVGVARSLAPDTGTGAELYAVIGHAPRQLDRNIAVVGRVIEGIEHLSTLPRGTAEAGVYATRAEDTPIVSVRLGSDMADPPAFEYLGTSSESFARYVAVRANRNDAFYTVPAGGVDVCNVQVPIRRVGE